MRRRQRRRRMGSCREHREREAGEAAAPRDHPHPFLPPALERLRREGQAPGGTACSGPPSSWAEIDGLAVRGHPAVPEAGTPKRMPIAQADVEKLTTTANQLVVPLHVRMPVILPVGDHAAWLDPGSQDLERLQALLRPYPAEEMGAQPVSTRVSSPSFDSSECTQPLA